MTLVCEQNREVQSYYTNQIAGNQQVFIGTLVWLLLLFLVNICRNFFTWS